MASATRSRTSDGALTVTLLAVILISWHQDYWLWDNGTLVFGILPMGLFWHICISLLAMLTWWLATRIAWPFDDGETDASEYSESSTDGGNA